MKKIVRKYFVFRTLVRRKELASFLQHDGVVYGRLLAGEALLAALNAKLQGLQHMLMRPGNGVYKRQVMEQLVEAHETLRMVRELLVPEKDRARVRSMLYRRRARIETGSMGEVFSFTMGMRAFCRVYVAAERWLVNKAAAAYVAEAHLAEAGSFIRAEKGPLTVWWVEAVGLQATDKLAESWHKERVMNRPAPAEVAEHAITTRALITREDFEREAPPA